MKIKLCTKRSKIKETEIEFVITASPAASKTCRAHHISPTRALAETTSSKLNTRIVNKTKMKHRIATHPPRQKKIVFIAQTRFRCNYSTFSQKGGMSNLLREKKLRIKQCICRLQNQKGMKN